MISSTHTHQLTFNTPSTRDYLNGGYGDLIAQCSCGRYEYVSSRNEGAYWHGLHLTMPSAGPRRLLEVMVSSPMPEGWEPVVAVVAVMPVRPATPRVYTCPTCVGAGSVYAGGSTHDGRYFHHGEWSACPTCQGSGTTDVWAA